MKKRILAVSALVLALWAGLAAWAGAETLPKSISLAQTRKVLGLGQGANTQNDKTRVELTAKPKSVTQVTYRVTSSKPQVVEAVQDAQGWYLQAVSKGKSTITAIAQRQVNGQWQDTDIRHRITVQVKENVRLTRLSASVRKLSLTVGEDYDLNEIALTYRPLYADCVDEDGHIALNWSASKASVARVENGRVAAVGKGKCNLIGRAPDGSGKKVVIALTVKAVAPTGLTLSQTNATLAVGDNLALGYTISPDNATNKQVTWSSTDAKVAAVDSQGNVTARKAGTARIICRAAADKKVTASCQIEVTSGDGVTRYRVYTVANAVYNGYANLYSTLNDQKLIAGAYEYAQAAGMRVESVVRRQNLTGAQLESLLKGMADSGADGDDVTVFFYSGHGYDQTGALVGSDRALVEVSQVRAYLDQVPGTAVLILDCCYSGQYARSKSAITPSQFNAKVIAAFAGGTGAKAAGDKYKVITACAADQMSYCIEPDYGFFARVAAAGLGCQWPNFTQGDLSADAQGDGQVTLAELYEYVKVNVPRLVAELGQSRVQQDVQTWPAGDQTVLLSRQR